MIHIHAAQTATQLVRVMTFSEVITAVGEPNITQEAPSLSGFNKGLSRAPADGSVGQRLQAVINCKWGSMNIK